jgi:hypothetical protein
MGTLNVLTCSPPDVRHGFETAASRPPHLRCTPRRVVSSTFTTLLRCLRLYCAVYDFIGKEQLMLVSRSVD